MSVAPVSSIQLPDVARVLDRMMGEDRLLPSRGPLSARPERFGAELLLWRSAIRLSAWVDGREVWTLAPAAPVLADGRPGRAAYDELLHTFADALIAAGDAALEAHVDRVLAEMPA